MNLLKTSFWSGISTVIKLLSGLIINKILAITVGPSGIAIIGQFQNIIAILSTIGSGAISNGITKYTAEHYDNKECRNKFIFSGLIITIFCSFVISLFIFLFNDYLSFLAFKSTNFSSIFTLLSFVLVFNSLNLFLLALLNGLKRLKLYILSNILSSIILLILTIFLSLKYQLYGAIISISIVPSITFFITVFIVIKKKVYGDISFKNIDIVNKDIFVKLFKYSLMAVTTIFTGSVVQILIRNLISDKISLEAAGYWQATIKVSDMYLLIITTALATYYLPRLSEIKEKHELQREVISSYKFITPVVIIASMGIFIFKDWIISILFSNEFLQMRDLFLFQILGDVLKMLSWIISYVMLARSMTYTFILTEVIFSIMYYFTTYTSIQILGFKGITCGYMITYTLYFITMLVLFRYIVIKKQG